MNLVTMTSVFELSYCNVYGTGYQLRYVYRNIDPGIAVEYILRICLSNLRSSQYSLYLFPLNYNKGFNHVHLYSPSRDTSFIFYAHISIGARKYLQHVHLIEETMMTHLPRTPHALIPLESSSYTHNSPPYYMYFISIFANLSL
jgi:hypothetical protein